MVQVQVQVQVEVQVQVQVDHLMGVTVFLPLLSKIFAHVAIDYRLGIGKHDF